MPKANNVYCHYTSNYVYATSRAQLLGLVVAQIREDLRWHRNHDPLMKGQDLLSGIYEIKVKVDSCSKRELLADDKLSDELRQSLNMKEPVGFVRFIAPWEKGAGEAGSCSEPVEVGGWRGNYLLYASKGRTSRLVVREKTPQADRIPFAEFLVIKRFDSQAAERISAKLAENDPEVTLNIWE